MARVDPRLLVLLPAFERQASRFAKQYSFALDLDDAVQLARVALWQCAERAPGLSVEDLGAYAWPRAKGSILDALRATNGKRRHALCHGAYGFDAATVLAARATGALPEVAFYTNSGFEVLAEPICQRPLPDALLSAARARQRRTRAVCDRLARLTDRQLRVVALVLLGLPQHVVAAVNGISQARVSQLLAWFAGRNRRRSRSRRPRRMRTAA